MKPKQLSMIIELSKCWTTKQDRRSIDYFKRCIEWGMWEEIQYNSDVLIYLWNKYQMQIRHFRRAQKRVK